MIGLHLHPTRPGCRPAGRERARETRQLGAAREVLRRRRERLPRQPCRLRSVLLERGRRALHSRCRRIVPRCRREQLHAGTGCGRSGESAAASPTRASGSSSSRRWRSSRTSLVLYLLVDGRAGRLPGPGDRDRDRHAAQLPREQALVVPPAMKRCGVRGRARLRRRGSDRSPQRSRRNRHRGRRATGRTRSISPFAPRPDGPGHDRARRRHQVPRRAEGVALAVALPARTRRPMPRSTPRPVAGPSRSGRGRQGRSPSGRSRTATVASPRHGRGHRSRGAWRGGGSARSAARF